jgi:hypothetical protein
MGYLIVILLAIGVGISKASADIVSHIDIWKKSIYNKYDELSFYGPKDKTWIRKDRVNKVLNYLLHNQLVFITDIWHFSNFINNLYVIFTMIVVIYYNDYYLVLVYWLVRLLTFPLFYHYIMKRKLNNN